ncbi:MAG TPA: YicC/YloC family endoribonuclease [Cyclobacteriaceae bacterium]|jgi:uncharacterized protein (TIGR00255 family)|nr:YicC/YloC family endoribonuclease [Cyclobacteriaceae bacterium]
MIKSMTGFGQAVLTNGDMTISVEVKSLNSKFLDLNLRLPRIFSEKELELRNAVAEKLERGKVSLSIDYAQTGKQEVLQTYNETLFLAYYQELKKLASKVGSSSYDNLFHTALNSPGVVQGNGKEELDPLLWEKANELVKQAISKCDAFRSAEGKSLNEKLVVYIKSIESALLKVEEIDPKRVDKIRSKIKGSVTAFFGEEGFDTNRLEQEIIFYIEKLDIHEERVRLRTHLDYFLKILTESQSNGKKLGFIAQEIGREINTIGSKANDAEMQKHVVLMKEELEKIKEQLNNVL